MTLPLRSQDTKNSMGGVDASSYVWMTLIKVSGSHLVVLNKNGQPH